MIACPNFGHHALFGIQESPTNYRVCRCFRLCTKKHSKAETISELTIHSKNLQNFFFFHVKIWILPWQVNILILDIVSQLMLITLFKCRSERNKSLNGFLKIEVSRRSKNYGAKKNGEKNSALERLLWKVHRKLLDASQINGEIKSDLSFQLVFQAQAVVYNRRWGDEELTRVCDEQVATLPPAPFRRLLRQAREAAKKVLFFWWGKGLSTKEKKSFFFIFYL